MKIGIVTITEGNNYGNKLQNYALQTFLEKKGIETRTLRNYPMTNNLDHCGLKDIYRRTLRDIKYYIKMDKARLARFNEFDSRIHFTKGYVTAKSKLNDEYDYFIAGSDQIWKPTYNRMSDLEFLCFADDDKKISYAASFGLNELPPESREKARLGLEGFKRISVREDAGRDIVRDLTGREDVEVLIDPTMLLDSNEWSAVSARPKELAEGSRYILCYFLGGMSDKRRQEIEKLAESRNCEIIDLLDKRGKWYKTGPSEFLYLEKHAELVCTDSFHSCVFALLFNRPFVVFRREGKGPDMNSRLDTLLSKFEIEGRRYNEEELTEQNLNHDYTRAYEILEEERARSDKFINEALGLE